MVWHSTECQRKMDVVVVVVVVMGGGGGGGGVPDCHCDRGHQYNISFDTHNDKIAAVWQQAAFALTSLCILRVFHSMLD